MGTIRGIRGQGRFKRHEPKLSDETLQELRTYALHVLENQIYDLVTTHGEVVVDLWGKYIIINDLMRLTTEREILIKEAIRNLARAEALDILERNAKGIRVKPTKSSELPDIQLKIQRILEKPGFPGLQTPVDLKGFVNDYGFNFRVKEINSALLEMKEKGLVQETKNWAGKRAWKLPD